MGSNLKRYMDDHDSCGDYPSTLQLESYSQVATVFAWSNSAARHAVIGGCTLAISSVPGYGMEFKFSSGYIATESEVTLNVYKGVSTTFRDQIAIYTSGADFPTSYQINEAEHITIELYNPNSSADFDFQMVIENYARDNGATVVQRLGYCSSQTETIGGIRKGVQQSYALVLN
ncbi:uncharacterized protein [Watersipora subatra]|uniref:uncharacterized protein n=1 Tax=Watersipora subatra TaxID=2589382 RepID=UPI00355BE32D